MSAHRRPVPIHALAALGLALGIAGVSPPARAEHCADGWDRPYVCRIEVYAAQPGQRASALDLRRPLRLEAGERLELTAEGVDQNGRRFPGERFRWELELDRRCSDLVGIDETASGALRLTAGTRRGECTAWLWVPGNLNLERRLTVEVAGRSRGGYSRGEAEWIAGRLYAAILGRDPDPAGLRGATVEIQRGRLSDLVETMTGSPEFATQRLSLPPAQILEELYRGLLGREPDSAGVRAYIDDVARRRVARVVMILVGSEEFDQRLLREAPR